MKRNLMKEAHKMTREIKEKYPEVDYQAQLGLCLSFLAQEEEEKSMEGLQGTEKQIRWAIDIIYEMKYFLDIANKVRLFKSEKKWDDGNVSENLKEKYNLNTKEDYLDYITRIVEKSESLIFAETDAAWYIRHFKSLTSEYKTKTDKLIAFSNEIFILSNNKKGLKQTLTTLTNLKSEWPYIREEKRSKIAGNEIDGEYEFIDDDIFNRMGM